MRLGSTKHEEKREAEEYIEILKRNYEISTDGARSAFARALAYKKEFPQYRQWGGFIGGEIKREQQFAARCCLNARNSRKQLKLSQNC